jgi:hypothetical protein
MGHHKNRGTHALPGLPEAFDDSPAGLGIQISGGLVGKNNQRIIDQAAGHRRPLFLTAGNLRRVLVHDMANPKQTRKLIRQFLRFPGHFPLDNTGHQDIFPNRKSVQKHKILEHKADLGIAQLCQFRLALPCEPGASDGDLSLVKRNVAGDTVEQRSLTRTGGPHDGHKFPLSHMKVDPL